MTTKVYNDREVKLIRACIACRKSCKTDEPKKIFCHNVFAVGKIKGIVDEKKSTRYIAELIKRAIYDRKFSIEILADFVDDNVIAKLEEKLIDLGYIFYVDKDRPDQKICVSISWAGACKKYNDIKYKYT